MPETLYRDEHENTLFSVRGNKYKLPRLNWQHEERFLIAASIAGINMSGDGDVKGQDINLFTNEGIELRKTLIPWLLHETEDGQYKQMTDQYQFDHFKSIIEVYEVLAEEIKAISYFLSQAQPSNQNSSNQKQESALKTDGKIRKPQPT